MKLLLGHPVLAAIIVSVLTLVAGAAAVVLADFGAPLIVFLLLLAWLATIGLPSTVGVLLVAALWGRTLYGSGFYGFIGVAGLLALILQIASFLGLRRWLAAKRKPTP
jgi:hypothetical protein